MAKVLNAKRASDIDAKPDRMTGRFSDGYLRYAEDMAICHRLVAIGAGITGKPLVLHTGGEQEGIVQAATDGTNIWLPKMHPRRRVAVKHELSHIYFKSNIALRLLFVKELIAEFEADIKEKLAPHIREKLTSDLCLLVNVLDDIRVNSLWGMLYPGDGEDMDEWYFRTVGPDMMEKTEKQAKGGDIENFFTFAILTVLGQLPKSSVWEDMRGTILQARDDVAFKAFPAALVIMRGMVKEACRRLVQKDDAQAAWGSGANPLATQDWKDDEDGDVSSVPHIDAALKQRIDDKAGPSAAAMKRALVQLTSGMGGPVDGFVDHNAGFDTQSADGSVASPQPTGNDAKVLKLIQQALDQGDFDGFLDDQASAGQATVQHIQRALSKMPGGGTNYYNQDDFLKKDVEAEVNLLRPKSGGLVPTMLNPEDRYAADQLRRMFQRVIGSSRVRLEEEGHIFCTDAYIQQKLSGQPLAPYFHATAGHGFSVNILVDMSGSMANVWKSVEKLVAVLQRALAFPFVDIRTTGFKQETHGEVDIVLFPKLANGLHGPTVSVGGQTPLSHAVQIGGRLISQGRNDKHVFLISDGFPVFTTKNSESVGTQTLINWTRSAVDDLRKQQVKVWAFMIGSSTPAAEEMTEMFGPKNWRKIPTDALYREGSKFVSEQFLKFVRSR